MGEMVDPLDRPVSSIGANDTTQDQLALATSERVSVITRYGRITGGRVKNGVQVFFNVPYGLDGCRFSDPQPLPDDYRIPYEDCTQDRFYAPPPEVSPPEEERMDKVGLGQPSESPFFANIYIPSKHVLGRDPSTLPVKVFIHGGFLQGGSPSSTGATQQFFAAEHWNEIRVLLGYRLGVLGFLAASSSHLDGNWGFKDVWLGLEWIQRNIHSFGGDPNKVHISGQSAGAHVVHNLLHRAARLAPVQAPFETATLYSNALFEDPFSLDHHQPQFEQLCQACGIKATGEEALEQLRDRDKIPLETLFRHARDLGLRNNFVPASGGWLGDGMLEYQRSGGMARDLLRAGVRCVIVGDVKDESEGYKSAHEVYSETDVLDSLSRWNRREAVEKMYKTWPPLPKNATQEQCQQRLGETLSSNRVYLPVRLLTDDMIRGGMPVIRYAIESVARNMNTDGLVPHGSDLTYHFLRLSILTRSEMEQTLAFYAELQACIDAALRVDGSFQQRPVKTILTWEKNGTISWKEDERWDRVQQLSRIVRTER